MHRSALTLLAALAVLQTLGVADAGAAEGRPNVLFIAVDDLRPEMECYGLPKMVTPNLDRLAAMGVRFDQAYCNIAVCGASRASLMKGLRPTPNRFTSYLTRADEDAPDVPSLPFTFKQHGYTTASHGKIYHHRNDDLAAWSEPPAKPDISSGWYALPENRPDQQETLGSANQKGKGNRNANAKGNANRKGNARTQARGPAYEAADVADSEYPDYQVCSDAIEDMQRMAKSEQPFFLACGFWRPHLPFVAPQKYWDLYPTDEVQLPDNMFFPRDLSTAFNYNWGEMRAYRGIPKQGPVSDEQARELIRGYHASVSFIDAQVGRLLDELETLGVADNTIVVLWGDHGWQLGEHGMWCKHTNFEVATRTPLLVAAPGFEGGRVSERLVEYVDIYPTLCELAQLPKPEHLHGQSMVPLLKDVDARFKEAVYTRHGGGDAVRTADFRYMEMRAKGGSGQLQGVGMFDLQKDPEENQDVSNDPAYSEEKQRLQAMLAENRKFAAESYQRPAK